MREDQRKEKEEGERGRRKRRTSGSASAQEGGRQSERDAYSRDLFIFKSRCNCIDRPMAVKKVQKSSCVLVLWLPNICIPTLNQSRTFPVCHIHPPGPEPHPETLGGSRA